MKKYYLIKVSYTSSFCEPFVSNIAISEQPIDFFTKQLKRFTDEDCNIILDFVMDITKEEYRRLKKYNPTNEGYFILKTTDYSKIIRNE